MTSPQLIYEVRPAYTIEAMRAKVCVELTFTLR